MDLIRMPPRKEDPVMRKYIDARKYLDALLKALAVWGA
jgi:hypothetical protein